MFKDKPLPNQKLQSTSQEENNILCRSCANPITSKDQAIEVENQHHHTFFNPAGLLYEISCFHQAPGCLITGRPTEEFSWFKGFAWRYAICNQCLMHLGWHFQSTTNVVFFGLISNLLVSKD